MRAVWSRVGPWSRKAVVLGMFLAFPMWIAWVAAGAMSDVALPALASRAVALLLVASLGFGGAAAALVWRDLDAEP